MINPSIYNITVRQGEFEGEYCFEARAREFPDLAEYGDSFNEAYELIIDAIETTAEVFAEKGKVMPEPYVIPDDYSGRVTLRLPKSLHREIAVASEDEGVSLNQYLVSMISYYSGYATGVLRKIDETIWQTIPTPVVEKLVKHPGLTVVSTSDIRQSIEWKETA